MYRGVWAVVSCVGLAAAGALVGGWLLGVDADAVAGGVIGAITGAFAPSLLTWLQARSAAQRQLTAVSSVRGVAGLLNPDAQVVPFTGRDEVMAGLVQWCEKDAHCPVRLVTGAGGQGKTRLALELCARLVGWRCEWVGDGQEAGAVLAVRAVHRKRVLLIVDYAEARVDLPKMLRDVAIDDGAALRVLLLARSRGDWWERLRASDSGIRDLLAKAEPIELANAVDGALSDADLVRQAVPYFASRLGTKPPASVKITGGHGRQRILDLHAAALVAVLDARAHVELTTALAELLEHEKKTWLGSARANGLLDGPYGMNVATLADIVAAGSLLGAATKEEAVGLLGRVPDAVASVKVATWLRELYPPDQSDADSEWLGSLQPDRLAEQLVVAQLERSREFAAACLMDLNARQARRASSLLERASDESPLRFLDASLDRVVGDIVAPTGTLIAIANAIPADHESTLAQAAATVPRPILEPLSATAGAEERATWLSKYSSRLNQVGLTAQALSAQRDLIALHREHATRGRKRREHQSWLSNELRVLLSMLLTAGELDEALSVADVLVARQRLDFDSPDRHIAEALYNRALVLVLMDRWSDAFPVAGEAVTEWRGVIGEYGPSIFAEGYIASLTLYAEVLLRLKRSGEALTAAEKAVAAYQETRRPHDYDLGPRLCRLAVTLSDLDQKTAATHVATDVIIIARKNAESDPRKYGVKAIRLLCQLSASLSKRNGDQAMSDAAHAAAIAIARQLSTAYPKRYGDLPNRLLAALNRTATD